VFSDDRVFVSYHRADRPAVKRLVGDLVLNGVRVWDYTGAEDALRLASSIDDGLQRKIDDAALVLLMASRHSVAEDSRWTRVEIEHAIRTEKPIAPFLLPGCPPMDEWTGAFATLAARRVVGEVYDPKDHRSVFGCVARLVEQHFHRRPQFRIEEHEQLQAYLEFFSQERVGELSMDSYLRLAGHFREFARAYLEEDYEQALRSIQRVIATAESEDVAAYSAQIARGTCLLHLDRPEEALSAFDTAASHPSGSNHHKCHEGRGHALAALGCFGEAGDAFDAALQRAPPKERRLRFTLFSNLTDCRLHQDPDRSDEVPDPPDWTLDDRELAKFLLQQGVSLLRLGRLEAAREAFERIGGRRLEHGLSEEDRVALASNRAHLARLGGTGDGITILREARRATGSLTLTHQLGRLLAEDGRPESLEEANGLYEDLLCERKGERRLRVERAITLVRLGRYEEACDILRAMLDGKDLAGRDEGDERRQQYFSGYGAYLIGEESIAEYCYRQSRGYGVPYRECVDPTLLREVRRAWQERNGSERGFR